jgi:uncharacterized protein (DUF488 family)
MPHELLTIGHSNHSLAHFILLLRRHRITAVADVRSSPHSSRHPHFNQRPLAEALLATAEIPYVFLGRQLGARPDDPECYTADGRVSFDRLARTLSFRNGLRRVLKGLERYRIALLCAEQDPLECHRGILIAPRLRPEVSALWHIGPDGSLESHEQAETRLLQTLHLPTRALFHDPAEQLAEAYRRQEERIAWRRPAPGETLRGPSREDQESG